nr:cysteine-rich RLK (receptor-like protein kinase) 8 [Tanacetum cinerariifolium]
MSMSQGNSNEHAITTTSNDAAMSARMDQLQNQPNQMILMMQNKKEINGMPSMSNDDKPKLIASCFTKSCKFITSHVSAKRYKFIASVLISHRYLWVADSGAIDHVCISITLMHNIQICTQPIYVTLPNGQTTYVTHIGSVFINSAITLYNVLSIPLFA